MRWSLSASRDLKRFNLSRGGRSQLDSTDYTDRKLFDIVMQDVTGVPRTAKLRLWPTRWGTRCPSHKHHASRRAM